jgi:hypothetical protein
MPSKPFDHNRFAAAHNLARLVHFSSYRENDFPGIRNKEVIQMIKSTNPGNKLMQAASRIVVPLVLLTSVNAFAATPVTLSSGEKHIPYSVTSASNPPAVQRVFKDDFEKHLVPVTRPHQTKMFWLGQARQVEKARQSQQIWLRMNSRSD